MGIASESRKKETGFFKSLQDIFQDCIIMLTSFSSKLC